MQNPWWKVDLGKEINVSVIMVKNSERTTTIRIFVSRDHRRGQRCGIEHVLEGREARVILCVPRVFGRYVTIEKIGKKRSLSLCEVQVFDKTGQ